MENNVILKLIDRQKRITNKLVTYLGLIPLGFFFIGCFHVPRLPYSRETVFESNFGFESYWRIIGPIGLLISVVTFLVLDRLIPYKKGKVHFTKDKLKIENRLKIEEFPIYRLKDFELIVDIPFETDDRYDFQKASVLKFKDNGRKFDFEINTETKDEMIALTPIIKHWRESYPNFKYSYK